MATAITLARTAGAPSTPTMNARAVRLVTVETADTDAYLTRRRIPGNDGAGTWMIMGPASAPYLGADLARDAGRLVTSPGQQLGRW
jgi:hypothetical protein